MLHSLPNLLASARYIVKTVPDKLLNLSIENARNKFTQKILLRNDQMTINLQSTTNTNTGFNAWIFRVKNSETTLQNVRFYESEIPYYIMPFAALDLTSKNEDTDSSAWLNLARLAAPNAVWSKCSPGFRL